MTHNDDTLTMNTIDSLLASVRQEYLRRMTAGDGDLLRQVEQYTAARQGKMLRPRLTLLAAQTMGDEALLSRRTLLMATAVEMVHNASLLHDDVIDRADERRGQPSVNRRWNNQTAVLVGDYHLAQLMRLLDEADDRQASERVNRTVMAMVEGELLQQELLGGRPLSEDDYLRVIDGKTARLFATACALGNPALEDFGLHYGRLFQLRDDQADHEETPFTLPLIAREAEAALRAADPYPTLRPLVEQLQ